MEGPDASRLPPRPRLWDQIIAHLQRVDHDSISGVARALSERREAPIHRLTVAGYLEALADLGHLKEVRRPPSREYGLGQPAWSLHQRVWIALDDPDRAGDDRVRLWAAVMQQVLHRPLFQAEVQHAGATRVSPPLERVVVADETRRHYRALLERRSFPSIPLPARDPLVALPEDDPAHRNPVVADVLREVLLAATHADHLEARRGGPSQTRLDEAA